jgi:signal-transduction protein with cAMP-binding, CBS, and nucleotidyltransferase domain
MSLKNFKDQLNNVTCEQDASISEVARKMKDEDVGTVLVAEEGKPLGFITDRDLVTRCLVENGDLENVEIKKVMSKPVHTIQEEASILDLIEEMGEKKIRRLCVVDSSGKTLGVISMADIFELLSHEISALGSALGERKHKLFRRNEKVRGVA